MLTHLLVAFTFTALLQDVQPAPQPSPDGPVVILDFLLADREGKTPTDLTPADVELKVGGKARPLLSLDLVAPPEGGRTLLLLLDEATLYGLEPAVKEGVTKLLDSLLPGDRVRYFTTRQRRASVVTGREAITQAVGSLVTGPGVLYSCLSDMVQNVATLTRTLPKGRASTLLLIARGHPEGAAYGSEGDAAPCTPKREDMAQVANLLSASQINVSLFTVGDTTRSWGFETLASNLGCSSSLLTWANTGALEQAVAQTRTFYRATIAADPKAPDRPQRVELKVKRPQVKATTASSLSIKAPAPAAGSTGKHARLPPPANFFQR